MRKELPLHIPTRSIKAIAVHRTEKVLHTLCFDSMLLIILLYRFPLFIYHFRIICHDAICFEMTTLLMIFFMIFPIVP